jgi:nucleoside-triphosphatase THEP1
MASRARHVFLTGYPGVGKTTAALAAVAALAEATGDDAVADGFITVEVRDPDAGGGGGRVGFDVVTLPLDHPSSRRAPLARLADASSSTAAPRVGRYAVDVASFESLAIPATHRAGDATTARPPVVVVDEIGKMEAFSAAFLDAARETMRDPRAIVLGTIPVGNKVPAAAAIRADPNAVVVEVTPENRDAVPFAVRDALLPAVRDASARPERSAPDSAPDSAPRPRLFDPAPLAPFLERGESRTVSGASSASSASSRRASSALVADPGSNSRAEPCGPLVCDDPATPPRGLLLGEWSSPKPKDGETAYGERSMWRVLDVVVGDPDGDGAATRARRSRATLEAGIAAWDVLADVHEKTVVSSGEGSRRRARDRGSNPGAPTPNDVVGFLRRRESVRRVAFVGAKAFRRFRALHPSVKVREGDPGTLDLGDGRVVEVRVVPSARGGGEEDLRAKAETWAKALLGGAAKANARDADETDAEPSLSRAGIESVGRRS